MNNAKIRLTQIGFDRFTQELARYQDNRPAIVLRLQAAREMGDLSENGAYKAARFELSDTDRQIRRLTQLLKYAVVQEPVGTEKAGFGNTVVLAKDSLLVTYTLVSLYEADPLKGLLSVESPLGKELLSKHVGDVVSFQAPVGTMMYTIKKIS